MVDAAVSKEEYRAILQYDPGNSVFVGFADLLRSEGSAEEAINVCLLGLTHNPGFHRGRLLLARLYYDKGYIPFAVREVETLVSAAPQNAALRKLLFKLSPTSETSDRKVSDTPVQTLAEAEFDIGELEMVEAEKAGKK